MKDILIVEDGAQERERLLALVKQSGYAAKACESVHEAERLVQEDQYRLAILDIGLSDRSGSHLFNTLKRSGRVSQIAIFTGNPSVHLKQRFFDEGAVDYIVKGSPQANNDALLKRIRELLGEPQNQASIGIRLEEFLEKYVSETSRRLFLDIDNSIPACKGCGARDFVVVFSRVPQIPPEVSGQVLCQNCQKPLDPEVG